MIAQESFMEGRKSAGVDVNFDQTKPYTPPTDEEVRRVIDAAKTTGMPTTALRWALYRLDKPHPKEC